MEMIRLQILDKNVQRCDYEHGGNVYRAAQELGIPESEIIDFSASINPLGISGKVTDAIQKGLDSLVNYPDIDSKVLREKIAGHHDIDPETIICGNGSTELIYLIPRALKPEKVLIPGPTFSEYEKAVKTQIKELHLKETDTFKLDPDEFIRAMHGCDMAFLCNPNNPTGDLLKKNEVLAIADAAKKEGCILVVDEAFIDFCAEESVIMDVRDNPYLVVLRSMTKFYALTGLRVGYGVFHRDVIDKVKQFKEPWTVNVLAQMAAIAAICDDEYTVETDEMMKREKDFLEKGLQTLGVEYLPSIVNYYLLKTEDADCIVSELRSKGILVRDCSNFKGLDSSYIRVAVKSRIDNEMLLRELSKLR
jgi:threonine-phosphate decarboxylase